MGIRTRILLGVGSIGCLAIGFACYLAIIAWGDLVREQGAGDALTAFEAYLRLSRQIAGERNQWYAAFDGDGRSPPADLVAEIARTDGRMTTAAAAGQVIGLDGDIAEAVLMQLQNVRRVAMAVLGQPHHDRPADAKTRMLDGHTALQHFFDPQIEQAAAKAIEADPGLSHVIDLARLAIKLRVADGTRAAILTTFLSEGQLPPDRIIEADRLTGEVRALWNLQLMFVGASGRLPGLTQAAQHVAITLMSSGEQKYQDILEAARRQAPAPIDYREWNALWTIRMLDNALVMLDASLATAWERTHDFAMAARIKLAVSGLLLLATLGLLFSVVRMLLRRVVLPVNALQIEAERIRAELRETQDELVESAKLAFLGSMVAGVAHEVNTPLGICITAMSPLADLTLKIKGALTARDLTEEDLSDFLARLHETLPLVNTNLDRAARLMRNFKTVAADQVVETPRRIELGAYLREVLLSLKPQIKDHAVTIEVEADQALEVMVPPSVVWQIISNLVLNSLLHGFADRLGGHITISLDRPRPESVRLLYCDDGAGMEEAVRARIFEPFFTTKRGKGGTGLGLFITYNLVTKALGGQIRCDSAPGRGVRFEIVIPDGVATAGAAGQVGKVFVG